MADENVTLQDVFRVVNEMREEMRAGFKEAAEERQAMREVIDNELAGQGQVMSLEGDVTEVKRSLRQLGKKVDAIGERLDRAKV